MSCFVTTGLAVVAADRPLSLTNLSWSAFASFALTAVDRFVRSVARPLTADFSTLIDCFVTKTAPSSYLIVLIVSPTPTETSSMSSPAIVCSTPEMTWFTLSETALDEAGFAELSLPVMVWSTVSF